MKLFVEMSDAEYEQFKQFQATPKLEDQNTCDLATALLSAIKRDGGKVEINMQNVPDLGTFSGSHTAKISIGKLQNNNYNISLVIETHR